MLKINVIKYLQERGFSNRIHAFSKNTYEDKYPHNVLNYDTSNPFESLSKEDNEWWQVSFDNLYIIPFQYRIKTINYLANHSHPKSWVIKASNDNSTWTEISKITKDNSLNGNLRESLFNIHSDIELPAFSHFRMIIKANHRTNDQLTQRLSLSGFEINGVIKNQKCTSECFHFRKVHILLF